VIFFLVGLERGGVKALDVEAEERGDKLYVTIKAEVDGAAGGVQDYLLPREGRHKTSSLLREG
jgi:hypothetical protein